MSYNPVGNVDVEKNPLAALPSLYYILTIRQGASEIGLPQEYQQFLNGIKHNGREGDRQGRVSQCKDFRREKLVYVLLLSFYLIKIINNNNNYYYY